MRRLSGVERRCEHTGIAFQAADGGTDRARARVGEGFCPYCPTRMELRTDCALAPHIVGRCPCCQQRWSTEHGGNLLIFHGVLLDPAGRETYLPCCVELLPVVSLTRWPPTR